jgi:predicted membrane-bound spermidine synthase
MRGRNLKPYLLALGAAGFAAQALLLRQFMAAFAGNELTAGIAVSACILWEAFGAWLSGSLSRGPSSPAGLASISVISTLVSFLAATGSRAVLGLAPGETLSLPVLAAIIFVLTSAPAALHGALFVSAVSVEAEGSEPASAGGRVYFWEGLGAALGGLLLAVLLWLGVSSLLLLALFCLVLLVFAAFLRAGPRTSRVAMPALLVAPAILLAVFAAFRAEDLERLSWQAAWPGQKVVSVRDSPLGRIVRMKRQDLTTVLYDGVPVLSSRPANRAEAEELALVPLLAVRSPRRVLVVGPALGAVGDALALWPGLDVTHVQPDPELAALDSSPGAVTSDPLRFLLQTPTRFDAILLLNPAPATLAESRLFTPDFYRLCRDRLNPGGVLALPAPGDPAALSPNLARLLATRGRTLRTVFPGVALLAVDFPLFLAGDRLPHPEPGLLSRLHSRPSVLDSAYLAGLLDPWRQDVLIRAAGQELRVRQSELFLNLVREGKLSSPWFGRLYEAVGRLPPWLGFLLLLPVLASGLWGSRTRGWPFSRSFAILLSGFAGASVTTAVMFAYQLRFGSLYSSLTWLLAVFMLGTVLGSRMASAFRPASQRTAFVAADILLVAAAASTLFLVGPAPGWSFFLIDALCGACLGLQFAVASACATPARQTGRIAALDLAGGSLGGLAATLFLVPVFGLVATGLFVLSLKFASLSTLALSRAPAPRPAR